MHEFMSEDFVLVDDLKASSSPGNDTPEPWKVLVVDDDQEMHAVTQLVLSNFRYQQRPLQFLNAHSAEQAYQILSEHDDIAVALVDVVMENDHAGLDLISQIRNELNNHDIRLILRTGQPGLAPAHQVIRDYDVSDYKNKTELNSVSLDTLMCASLRAYQELLELKQQRCQLQAMISSATTLPDDNDHRLLAKRLLDDMLSQSDTRKLSALVVTEFRHHVTVLASSGKLSYLEQAHSAAELPSRVQEQILGCKDCCSHYTDNQSAVFHLCYPDQPDIYFYLESERPVKESTWQGLAMLVDGATLKLQQRHLEQKVAKGQLEMIKLLNNSLIHAIESPNSEQRELRTLAEKVVSILGLSESEQQRFVEVAWIARLSSIGIPESLFSQCQIDPAQWQKLASHCDLPDELTQPTNQQRLSLALSIANQHHESWDGQGQPMGLQGEEIHLFARLSALISALHPALEHKPSELKQALESQAGARLDPQLVAKLLPSLDTLTVS